MPKVIDLPTAASMDDGDYLLMEESTGGTKKITKANVLTGIGSTLTAANTITSLSPSEYIPLCQITLTPGTWIVTAQERFQMPESGKTMIGSIALAPDAVAPLNGGMGQMESSFANGYMSMNLVRITNHTASTTVYLVGYHNCSTAATIQEGQCFMNAIRIR